jgi:hypothetical protein
MRSNVGIKIKRWLLELKRKTAAASAMRSMVLERPYAWKTWRTWPS